MFGLNRVIYYKNVLTSDEPTNPTILNEAVVVFWKNLYCSDTDAQDYSKVVQKVFIVANNKIN